MGEVYRARDPRLGRDVAVKVASERFSERFDREARAVATLNNPNICAVYDVGPNYLVMELVEGPTLAERIAEGPIPLAEALVIASQIAEALEAAHDKGIVHRYLKPGNIKITPQGAVKVLDFGLAKWRRHIVGRLSTMAMQPRRRAETSRHRCPMSPRGRGKCGQADVWPSGGALTEMVTDKLTVRGRGPDETLPRLL
jgi:serine/threonine protein kinase